MAGHSKWANIKHKKARADAQKGKIFTKLAKEIIVAAREGGGDPENNFKLKLVVNKAREANMPNENINRAIKRGTGEIEGDAFESVVYEGYGPGGIAFLILIYTNNRNRTAAEVRSIFSKLGGNLGESGCVSWMFKKNGLIVLDKEEAARHGDEEEFLFMLIEEGAQDIVQRDDVVEIITRVEDLERLKNHLSEKGIKIIAAEITMIPDNEVSIKDEELAHKLLQLVETLEDHDDVQEVYGNYNIDI